MDGWITIGTKLETGKFDREVSELENKIESAEKKQEIINQKTNQYQGELNQATSEVQRLSEEFEKASQKADILRNAIKGAKEGSMTYEQFQASREYNEQIAKVDALSNELSKAEIKQSNLNTKVQQSKLQYDDINDSIQKYKNKIESINLSKQKSDLSNIDKSIKNMNNNVGKSIKQVANLAMGVFSVASAYALVSRASATLAQYDKQYSANLEYIQYALAQVIAPVLKYLVNLAATLLSYINYLAQAWFGVNLFANASAKSFTDIASSASSTANSAKEIKKQLAGFDEMTVLGNSQEGTLGNTGGTGITTPSVDVSQIQGDVPDWLKWLADNGDKIKEILLIIGSALAGLKLASIAKDLGLIGGNLSFIKGLGIGAIIYGIIKLIELFPDYFSTLDSSLENNGTSWEQFGGIVNAIGIIITGVGIIIGGIPAIITGAIVAIVGVIMKYWEQIKSALQSAVDWLTNLQQNATDWLFDNLDWIGEKFGLVGQLIVGVFVEVFNWGVDIVKGAIDAIMNIFDGLFKGIKGIFDGILLIFKGDFGGGLLSIGKGIVNALIGILNGAISALNAILYPIRALISAIGNVFGANWTVDLISIPHIPYLKTGGIVNLPNQGVNIGGAMAGEAGAEGVIPLTDSQAMETLGQAIGKYITINANITNSMNGRVISRQLKKIQGTSDFAYNR